MIDVTPRYSHPLENGTVLDRTYDTQSEESSTQSRPPQAPQLSCESRSQSLLSLGSVGTNKSEQDQSAESPLTAASVEFTPVPVPVPTPAPPLPPSIEAETEAEARDDVDMLKEVEKMDKESRAARRAFEQRIQKHKLIQVRHYPMQCCAVLCCGGLCSAVLCYAVLYIAVLRYAMQCSAAAAIHLTAAVVHLNASRVEGRITTFCQECFSSPLLPSSPYKLDLDMI